MVDDFSRVTIVFAMPRCRTQWLAWFFRHCGIPAWHDPMAMCASPAELVRNIRAHQWEHKGPLLVVDTAAIFFHNQLRNMLPGSKAAYMFRHPADVDDSVYRQTGTRQRALFDDQNARLYRHGFGDIEDKVFRLFHGVIDQRMPAFWQFVAGKPMPKPVVASYGQLQQIRVDVPLAKQPVDIRKGAQLMKYKEQ